MLASAHIMHSLAIALGPKSEGLETPLVAQQTLLRLKIHSRRHFYIIWYNLKFIIHAMERRIRIDSSLTIGANDSSKSMPLT